METRFSRKSVHLNPSNLSTFCVKSKIDFRLKIKSKRSLCALKHFPLSCSVSLYKSRFLSLHFWTTHRKAQNALVDWKWRALSQRSKILASSNKRRKKGLWPWQQFQVRLRFLSRTIFFYALFVRKFFSRLTIFLVLALLLFTITVTRIKTDPSQCLSLSRSFSRLLNIPSTTLWCTTSASHSLFALL